MYTLPATLYKILCTNYEAVLRDPPARRGPTRRRGRPAHPLGRAQQAQQPPHPPSAATSRLLRPPPTRPGRCACSAERGGAPTPPRDRCGPSRAPPARPSPAQPQRPALRPSQPSRQPACSNTRPRRALALARIGALEGDEGGHADRRSSLKESSPRLLVEVLPEFTYSTNRIMAASLAGSSWKAGEAPARNTLWEARDVRCGIEIAGRVRG